MRYRPLQAAERRLRGAAAAASARCLNRPINLAVQPAKCHFGPYVAVESVHKLLWRTAHLVLSVLLGCLDNPQNDKSLSV